MKVLSTEQMTKLKNLGVDTSKASVRVGTMYFKYRAFTLQDVIELLPKRLMSDFGDADLIIQPNRDATVYVISYEPKNDIIAWFYDENILDAAYEMLIWVIENGHLKTMI